MGLFIDKTQKHLLGIRILSYGMTLLYLCALYLIPLGNLGATVVFCFFGGLLNVPILPASYAFVSKLIPGMIPAVVNGLMMSAAMVYSCFLSLLMVWLLSFD